MTLVPVAPRERLLTLDVLRGIALWGVLVGNMVLYSGRWAQGRRVPNLPPLDAAASWFLQIFVQSKAQTLLTLLFGFGFAMQLIRAEAKGEPVVGLYVRRLSALLVLGLLHVALLWWGDVVWGYAISGFGLLLFLHASNRARVIWGLALIFVPNLLWRIPAIQQWTSTWFLAPGQFKAETAAMAAAMQGTDHLPLPLRHLEYALVFSSNIVFWYFFWTLGRFLLGYVAGKLRWFDDDGARHRHVFVRMARWGGGVAVIATALVVLTRVGVIPLRSLGVAGRLVGAFVEEVTLLSTTTAYVGITVLLMQRPGPRRLLGLLAPAGRMPLTTYFAESLICTFLFYSWGLGWAGKVSVAGTLGLALVIFPFQVAFAHLWLRRFRTGPLEWVWRSLVYWKRQPMRLEG